VRYHPPYTSKTPDERLATVQVACPGSRRALVRLARGTDFGPLPKPLRSLASGPSPLKDWLALQRSGEKDGALADHTDLRRPRPRPRPAHERPRRRGPEVSGCETNCSERRARRRTKCYTAEGRKGVVHTERLCSRSPSSGRLPRQGARRTRRADDPHDGPNAPRQVRQDDAECAGRRKLGDKGRQGCP